MKARVKATGEIVSIEKNVGYPGGYVASNGKTYHDEELEVIVNCDPDYWTRLEHQYAGMAMQGLLSNHMFFKDENGNVINATKIVLEKKKEEYPKTYAECCKIMGIEVADLLIWDNMLDPPETIYYNNLERLLHSFRKVLICRDAYWKIAGEEMGLGKPWKPRWNDGYQKKCCIYNNRGDITKDVWYFANSILAFPTPEMRDAFYENFKELINSCKELL